MEKLVATYFLNLCVYSVTLGVVFTTLALGEGVSFRSLNNLSRSGGTSFPKFAILVSFLSLSGLPPFLGFFAKFLVFLTLVNKAHSVLTLFFLAFNLFALYFYLQSTRHLVQNAARKTTRLKLGRLSLPSAAWSFWLGGVWLLCSGFFFLEHALIQFCSFFL
jgi:NADH:ubiquinone oxidoreductase subunit 2 (subunit N)